MINIFDFDGTLTTETWPKFWVWVKKFGYSGEKRNDNLENALAEYRATHIGNALETFFGFFNDLLTQNNEILTYEELMEGEKYIKYNPGVNDFLEKSFAKNYIVSGGLKEFLQKLKIANSFDGIYGTPVKHNQNGLIYGIGEVMTDDKKILAIKDILKRNNRQENDCRNVYYIGDGYSDLIAMKFVHSNGGKAIFVYQPNQDDELYQQNKKIYEKLNVDGMVDFCCVANYRKGSDIFNILQRRRIKKINTIQVYYKLERRIMNNLEDLRDLIIYQSQKNENISVEVLYDNEDFWLTQKSIGKLFGVAENNITYHLQNIFADKELEENRTTQKIRVVQKEGNRNVSRELTFTMEEFAKSINEFLEFRRYDILKDNGKISRKEAEEKAEKEYIEFNKTQKITSDFDKLLLESKKIEKQEDKKQ